MQVANESPAIAKRAYGAARLERAEVQRLLDFESQSGGGAAVADAKGGKARRAQG